MMSLWEHSSQVKQLKVLMSCILLIKNEENLKKMYMAFQVFYYLVKPKDPCYPNMI